MNISMAEEISQQNSDLEIIRHRVREIEKKCDEQRERELTRLPPGFYLDDTSLWYQEPKEDEDESPVRLRICSRLEIIAVTRNQHGEDFGRLLQWHDCDGRMHTWAMPMSMLASEGYPYLGELLSKGLEIEPGRMARQKLTVYIQSSRPTARGLCTPHVGWHHDCFVLPSRTIGQTANEQVILQSNYPAGHFSTRGTLENWQQIPKLCAGNSRLVFALSMSFASILLTPLGIESGGVHFQGTSSLGKTTILRAAATPWGGKDYVLTWRATTNGLEGIAMNHNDTLLCLDELGQSDPDKVGEATYMLANGSKKVRSDASGDSKPTAKWRILYISSGETNLAGHLMQVGKKTRAGQEVRILDIPADTGKYGAFENLHHYPTGDAFANALNLLTTQFYGTAAIHFIEQLIANKNEYLKLTKEKMQQFERECFPPKASGQVARVLNRFAVIAAAGELATKMGITGWQHGEAFQGVKSCFEAWLLTRGSIGLLEREQIKAHIRRFFELNGESRFIDIAAFKAHIEDPSSNQMQMPHQKIANRAGFRESEMEKTTYYVLPEVFNVELCVGFDKKLVESVCMEEGWLIHGKERVTSKKRLPQMGAKWVYMFTNRVLGDED